MGTHAAVSAGAHGLIKWISRAVWGVGLLLVLNTFARVYIPRPLVACDAEAVRRALALHDLPDLIDYPLYSDPPHSGRTSEPYEKNATSRASSGREVVDLDGFRLSIGGDVYSSSMSIS